MKIGFFFSFYTVSSSNGVISQALTWKRGLEKLGHEVVMMVNWQAYDLKSFDAIVFYSFSESACGFINGLYSLNKNIILAPILDPDRPISAFKLYAHWGCTKLRLSNRFHALRQVKDKIKTVLVRSEFEKKYMVKVFDFSPEKCIVVRLSHGVGIPTERSVKENFCLHISFLCDERKNVKRLIDAAIKYKFKLVLAGKLRNEEERKLLNSWIEGVPNVEYRGFITEEEKMDLYARAKVFALPSTNEGVGIVALEAAAYGCDIVVTSLGGPHEYYADMAKVVNPYNVDEIGRAVHDFLDGDTFQPALSEYVDKNYSLEKISKKLESTLSKK
jgi:glycosyltransferase involved in cell wall biosynthesis